jgi:flavodoxin
VRRLSTKNTIIYVSIHHGNTEKVAKTFAKVLNADLKKPEQIHPNGLSNFDLIGFGSGIYFGKHHKSLLEFAEKLPPTDKKAFIFSTNGGNIGKMKPENFHKPLKAILTAKGFNIVGEFNCAGFDTYGLLKLVGGISKGRPNEEDLKNAESFAENLRK